MTINRFLKECNSRKVFKLLSIYVVSSWVLLQVLSVISQPLGMPEKSVTYLILSLLIGFPIYIFYLWKTRVRFAKSNEEGDIGVNIKNEIGFKRMYFTGLGLISIFSVIAVFLIINKNFTNGITLPKFTESDKIAVLKFDNITGDTKFDIIGAVALDWIQYGITEHKLGQVITQEIVNDYAGAMQTRNRSFSDSDILSTFLKPSRTVTGSYVLNGDQLIFNCSIKDGRNNETLISFPKVECDSDNRFDCIEKLRQNILGYLATEESQELNLNLQDIPPTFEAYQYFLDAKSNLDNKPLYLNLLNKAIAADSTYFEALAYKVLYYYNQGNYKTADSLRLAILPKSGISQRQRNLMNHYDALIKGDNKKIYNTSLNEYNVAPFHLRTNQTMMVIGFQYVNKVNMVDDFYDEIEMTDLNLDNCLICVYRLYIKALADLEKKDYSKVSDLLVDLVKQSDNFLLKRPLLSAYMRSGNFEALDALLSKIKLVHEKKDWEEANIIVGKELLLYTDNIEQANSYFDAVINSSEDKNGKNFANSHYYKGDYAKAEVLLQILHDKNPEDIKHLSKLAITLFKNGKTIDSENSIQKLSALRADYQYGSIDYAIAMIYASQNKNNIAIEHLMMSVMDGNTYSPELFQNDFHFKAIINTPEFNTIMNLWNK